MLAKNTRMPATIAAALITGLLVALWLALMPGPAKAANDRLEAIASEPVSRLQLQSIVCHQTEDSAGEDEPYIKVGGAKVWEGDLNDGESANLTQVPQISFQGNAILSLFDGDNPPLDPDDPLGSVEVSFTGGTPVTKAFTGDGAFYEITYVVHQDVPPPNNPPVINPLKPAPGSAIRDRTPLIAAKVSDAETELAQSNITLRVDGNVRSFAYDAANDKLLRQSNRLAFGKHTVSITATDGLANTTRTWRFKVVR
jgi:hypothetical protein